MKRPLQLPLAIALALSGTDALALGLGTIHVNSKLNQPLDAEIPVLQGTQGEAEGLLVQLAAAEDFDRVGLNRSRLAVPLEFSIVKGSRGDLVIKVTSKEVIREPFLDFLVEANWPKGRLLREYTVLLDPPVMAPATGTSAVATAAKTPERAPTQPLPEARPKAPAKPAKAPPVAAAPRAEPAPSKPAPTSAEPKRAAASGEYTVEAGDTLSGIARDVRSDESTNINQLMLALLKQNPNAFFKDNINSLKRGSILRIPSADQVKSVASASEAAATVHQQIEDWRGGAAAKPTLVADTGTPTPPPPKAPAAKATSTPPTSTASKTPSERLELVPPKAGKDTVAMADRPGSGAGAGANSEAKAELARAKEALASRDQEAGELKSRVKELEETKGKSDRLLSLKDSEIADLQRKLKDLQDQSKTGSKAASTTTPATSTTPSTTPPATPAATTTTPATGTATKGDAAKVSKEDIWGTAATTPDTKTTSPSAPASTSTTASTTTPSTPTGSASTTTPSATPSTTPSTDTTATAAGTTTPTTSTPSSTTPAGTTSTSSTTPSTTTPSATTPSSTASSTTPASTIPSTPGDSSSTASTPPPKPAATTAPIKPTPTSKTIPLAPTAPAWYEQTWVKPAAIGAGALLLLAGLLGMRKRRVPAVERGSIAGAFGDTPLRADGIAASADAEEESLRDQLMQDPANLGLHLELLSLFYSERNIDAFEDAAHAMHAQVIDPHQPEWLEAKAMGQELAPHNPLFADSMPADDIYDDEAVTAPHATTSFDHDEVFNPRETVATAVPHATTSAFDFDLDTPEPTPAPATPPPPSEAAFAFDNLPPIDFVTEARHEIETAIAPAPLPVDEEFPGDDGVGTKLDLAKAYLDMGDPEGARSMLEEVLAEGNDTQKGEAQRLMADIR